MKKLFIKQMYSTEQYKNLISIADLPPIRIKAESLFTDTIEKKRIYWFKEGKWSFVSYIVLLPFISNIIERNNPSMKFNVETLNRESKLFLDNFLTTKVEVMQAPQEPSAKKAFVFSTDKVFTVTPTTITEALPSELNFNYTSIKMDPAIEVSSAKAKEFRETKTWDWLWQFTDRDISYIKYIQELAGVSMVASIIINNVIFVQGDPKTGKGTLLKLFRNLVGNENVRRIPLERFTDKNVKANLEGTLLNASPENNEFFDEKTLKVIAGHLSSVTGCEPLLINLSNNNTYKVNPTAKHFFGVIDLPKFLATGFAKQPFVVLPARHKFVIRDKMTGAFTGSREPDFLLDRVGLINWAFEGLQRYLLNNKGFSGCKAIADSTNACLKLLDTFGKNN